MQYGLYFVSCLFILQVCSIISIIYELNISLNSLVELVDGTSVECLCLFMAVQFEHLAAVMEQDGERSFCQNKHMLFVVTLPTSRCWGIVAAWINKTNSRSNNLSSKAILNISALREHQINVYALTYNCSTVFLKGLS